MGIETIETFNEDLEIGKIIENSILNDFFKPDYPKAFIRDKKDPRWDIYIPELKYGVESKGDYKSKDTGNIIVEVEMNNKPSALSVTKAKFWVIVTGYRYIWLTPLDIYRFIEQNHLMRFPLTGSGDTVPKEGYLLKHDKFVTYATWVGKVNMIPENHLLYYDNFIKIIEAKNDKKNKFL